MKPQPGQAAPDFTASVVGEGYDDSSQVGLSDLKGSRVVLYFYPRDLTPGCTIQACALRDEWDEIPTDVKLFGVSPDDAKSHRKFIDKKALPFPL
ncbi:MAG: peroxiredoxin, partial [Pseudomonadota bacterium]